MIFVVHCESLLLLECYLITIFVAIVTNLPVNYQENLYVSQVVEADFDFDSS